MSDILDAVPAGTGSLLAGRYRLIERVGSGGMGTVYRARDELLGRDVAVKLFHSERADGVEDRRKVGEATMLASLSHPCLVTLFDACIGTEAPSYLVMEYIAGPTLRQRLVDGALGLDEAAAMASDLAAALEAVHAAGIVHRDVKPSNVMLRARGRGAGSVGYQAVLADFGVAHLVDSTRLTTPGDVIGTAAYLAPEQVRGHAPVPASDVYSLGLLLIEAITGRHPFADAPAASMLLARLTRQPDVPTGIGYAWRSLLTAMTVHDPASRPSASEVLDRARALPSTTASAATVPLDDALLVATSPISVSAPPAAATEPLPAPLALPAPRRRRRIVAMSAAAGVLIVAAAAVGISTVLAPAPVSEESVVPVQLNTVPTDDGSDQAPAETVESDDQSVVPADTVTPRPGPVTDPQPGPVTDPQTGPASENGSNRGPGNNNGNGNGKKP
ncbi:serine/threonine protein kinase [Microbacterium sp. SORGH_AS428]|uniref:serine/threonine-protein kinase n=1 Tax=Microbacterium sp. SORGH_AS_0428 TaxID=3041788 RepID=UPI00285B1307|nr:protein kinase [Microbacterium sp. SORGH_AS_0428]MDR6198989.1 serine/threonine protein kinase [Microbacterium sp. SORGH_AS_0428]